MTEWYNFPIGMELHIAVQNWLLENVGAQSLSKLDTTGEWFWRVNVRPEELDDRLIVSIRDPQKAMLYKLTWG